MSTTNSRPPLSRYGFSEKSAPYVLHYDSAILHTSFLPGGCRRIRWESVLSYSLINESGFARSTILTGSPISRTKICRPLQAPLRMTSLDASGIVIKYLVIAGCVTVTGPPFQSAFENRNDAAAASEHISETDGGEFGAADLSEVHDDHFCKPFRRPHDIGLTALSEEISTKVSVPHMSAASATFSCR